MEEGSETTAARSGGEGLEEKTDTVAGGEGVATAGTTTVASTQSAYIQVIYRDLASLLVTADTTQIYWSYNGSTVSGGSTVGYWQWNYATNWVLDSSGGSDLYGSGSSYYRGETWSNFHNTDFCGSNLPTVYVHYFYVRMWGHPNGTATWSQSSTSDDECITFYIDFKPGYGQFPG
jgi:hypothetical protein